MPPASIIQKSVITSWDDTSQIDFKLVNLLEKYGVKASFFVITDQIGKKISKDDVRSISQSFEVGSHTVSHHSLPSLSENASLLELSKSKSDLDELLGKNTSTFCYPYGNYNDSVIKQVRSVGYKYARTFDPYHFEVPKDLFQINVGVWAEPHGFFYSRGAKNTLNLLKTLLGREVFANSVGSLMRIRNWLELSKRMFDIFMARGSVFHLVGHAWRIEENNEWGKLEELLTYISARNSVRYLNIGEYASTL